MNIVVGILIGIFMLMLLVVGHEFGHFLMARRNGVEVEEFGIGFPPRVVCWRKVDGKWRVIKKSEWEKMPGKGLILSLNLLPIGGFCQMKGENAEDVRKGTFGAASFWRKTKILFGGVIANWIMAFVVFTALALIGMPHFLDNQFEIKNDVKKIQLTPVMIGEIISGSPAAKAGLAEGDVIKTIRTSCIECENDSVEVIAVEDLLDFDKKHAGEKLYFNFERDGAKHTTEVALNEAGAEYMLGASVSGNALYVSSWSAPIVGIGTTLQITAETFKGTGALVMDLFRGLVQSVSPSEETRESGSEALGRAKDSVSGPVGIIGVMFPAFAESGVRNTMFLVGLISISLACMNVLPIPALDGGRWLLIAIYKALGKKLTKETEEKIVSRAFVVILALALIVTIIDIVRIAE